MPTTLHPHAGIHFDARSRGSQEVREFLAGANSLVDEIEEDRVALGLSKQDVLEYLREHHAGHAARHAVRVAAQDRVPIPARFTREPDICLENVRFGRLRLFLSRFIGDVAWRGASLALLLCAMATTSGTMTGCANIQVKVGCPQGAPLVTNAPSHAVQRHPACGTSL